MTSKVAFIGLGVMGYPMAGYISKAGHNVTVFNRTKSKAEKWIGEYKGNMADTPSEAAKDADFIFTCVGNDDDLRQVSLGDNGLFHNAKEGCVYIDNSTVSAEISRELYKAAKDKGFGFLDAPISGGQSGAEGGILTVMVGGDENDFKKAEPIIDCYSKKVTLIGPSGSGQLTKMVNQMCIGGLVQGLSEAVNFGINAGLDMDKVMETISKGAAQSWQMENRYKTMVADKFDYGFAVDWMRKDLKICIEEAKRNGSPVPVTEIVDGYYAEATVPYYEDFSEIKKKIWLMLTDAVTNRSSPFRIPVFSCGSEDNIESRIVVLRKSDEQNNLVQFHSDIRSDKIKILEKNPNSSMLFYDKDEKIQVRLKVEAIINHNNDITKQSWEKTQHISRKCYLVDNGPGTESDIPTSGLKPELDNFDYTKEQSEEGYKNFTVIQCKIKSIEWLYLAAKGHRRARFDIDNSKDTWLVP